MLSTVKSYVLDGITARPVRVEIDVHRGLPSVAIVGLPDVAVHESRERIQAALLNSGFKFPQNRIVVNLAPASLRKAGPGLDLAIAVGILLSSGQLAWPAVSRFAFVGELALDGSTRVMAGSLPIAEAAREDGTTLVLPEGVAVEAALVSDIDLIALDSLARLPDLIAGRWEPVRPALPAADPALSDPDLADLRGQDHLRRALEVAAAGGHNLLLIGPPSAGKSLAAARLPSILPPLSAGEMLELARIASATGRFDSQRPLTRPFRAPHHTISTAGLVGGGVPIRPGEATLAHRGILYLDELPEFSRASIEALRSGLRGGEVVIRRAETTRTFPARFMLIAGANPCPCGHGEADPHCTCGPVAVQRHQGRLNSALADGIDIALAIEQPTHGGDRRACRRVIRRCAGQGDRGPRAPGATAWRGSLQYGDDASGGFQVRPRARRERPPG